MTSSESTARRVDPSQHPADVADRLQKLPAGEAHAILVRLPEERQRRVLTEIDPQHLSEILSSFEPEALGLLISGLPNDQAADVLGELPLEKRSKVLDQLSESTAEAVLRILKYPEDSAGGIMSDRLITLRSTATVEETQDLLRAQAGRNEDEVSYLYVTDHEHHLVGVVPWRELVIARPHQLICDIMRKEVKSVQAEDDQERVARLFQQYHYLALPVLDRFGKLAGIVKANQVIDILREEATEDMQLMVGLSGEEGASTPWRKAIGKRLPWLYINLGTAVLAATVVGFFEDVISKWTVLAVFLPVVAGQGGNAAAQTLTVVIRGMALGEIHAGEGKKVLMKELIMGILNGLAIGVVVGLIGWLWKGDPTLGWILGVAMVLNMIAAALSGVMVPFGLKAMKVDPALASSIFVTTVTDVAGFFFFLGLAWMFLTWFAK